MNSKTAPGRRIVLRRPTVLGQRLLIALIALAWSSLTCGEQPAVVLHLLDHTRQQVTKSRFWIDWSKEWRGITSTKSVTGREAERLVELLKESLLETNCANACGHDPVYGIEATTADGKILKTSLCCSCCTWVKPGRRLDIAGEPGINNPPCLALRSVIELPDELLRSKPKP